MAYDKEDSDANLKKKFSKTQKQKDTYECVKDIAILKCGIVSRKWSFSEKNILM